MTSVLLPISIIILSLALLILVGGFFYFKAQRQNIAFLHHQAKIGQKTKSDFLANMTHEVRTPLHAIIGTAQLLQESALSLRQKKQVGDIVLGGESLLQMFEDLIQISQVDQNQYHSNVEEVELDQWLESIMKSGHLFLKEKELGLSISIRPFAKYRLRGDFATMRKILFHLVINSYKFTQSGEVSLEAEVVSPTSLRLQIRDTGPGISKSSMEHIFEAFWQENDASDKRVQGAGVGLAVAKRLCDFLGAKFYVESEQTKGSVFTLDFPIELIEKNDYFVPESFAGTKVSIIDSHFMERQGLAIVLTNLACEIIYNGDSPETWNDVIQKSDKIIISSEMLYHKGKWNDEKVALLKNVSPSVTVLFSHASDLSLIRKFARLGFAYYLLRPFLCSNILQQEILYDAQTVDGERKRVLLVDDEPDFLILLEESINENLDLQVFKAQNGQDGFDILTTKNIDIIVLDIEMKGIGGVEFFNRMQAMGIDLPVLFLSAHYLDEDLLNNVDGRFLYKDKYAGMEEIMRSINTLLIDRGDRTSKVVPDQIHKIMVVDDSDVNTSLIEMMLGDLNCQLCFAFNGREAVELYRKELPEVVLMDLQMPVMDGFEAVAQIRDLEKRQGLSPSFILALSAYSTEEEISKAEAAGANQYLTKPIKRNVLLEIVQNEIKLKK